MRCFVVLHFIKRSKSLWDDNSKSSSYKQASSEGSDLKVANAISIALRPLYDIVGRWIGEQVADRC